MREISDIDIIRKVDEIEGTDVLNSVELTHLINFVKSAEATLKNARVSPEQLNELINSVFTDLA